MDNTLILSDSTAGFIKLANDLEALAKDKTTDRQSAYHARAAATSLKMLVAGRVMAQAGNGKPASTAAPAATTEQ